MFYVPRPPKSLVFRIFAPTCSWLLISLLSLPSLIAAPQSSSQHRLNFSSSPCHLLSLSSFSPPPPPLKLFLLAHACRLSLSLSSCSHTCHSFYVEYVALAHSHGSKYGHCSSLTSGAGYFGLFAMPVCFLFFYPSPKPSFDSTSICMNIVYIPSFEESNNKTRRSIHVCCGV